MVQKVILRYIMYLNGIRTDVMPHMTTGIKWYNPLVLWYFVLETVGDTSIGNGR